MMDINCYDRMQFSKCEIKIISEWEESVRRCFRLKRVAISSAQNRTDGNPIYMYK